VRESLKLAEKIEAYVRFQRLVNAYPQIPNTWTVGLPNHTFPHCDVCITYSDTPYMRELVKLKQVGRVMIYMLSYGMSIENERRNVLTPKVTVMCSTKKLEAAISAEGVNVHRIGFALDMQDMGNDNLKRDDYLALYYNPMESKKYDVAVTVADYLFKEHIISGVVVFGTSMDFDKHIKPKGIKYTALNASRTDVRAVFNSCKAFLMPSVSEGLNLTPVESTLCGCPAVICDGAIDELFFDKQNCFVSERMDYNGMAGQIWDIMLNYDQYAHPFEQNMREIVKDYNWDKVITNLKALL
jgi:glycosyltransferase involved in cell wall biosynthesis